MRISLVLLGCCLWLAACSGSPLPDSSTKEPLAAVDRAARQEGTGGSQSPQASPQEEDDDDDDDDDDDVDLDLGDDDDDDDDDDTAADDDDDDDEDEDYFERFFDDILGA